MVEDKQETSSNHNGIGTKEVEDSPPPPPQIAGTDWESANYEVRSLEYGGGEEEGEPDEVSAMDANARYVVLQYLVEPHLDVFDLEGGSKLARLGGHSYGGRCVRISSGRSPVIYSGSLDKTVRAWNAVEGSLLETIYNHLDYVESLGLLSGRWVASGGRGDKAIFVYETDGAGKLWRRHRFDGHEGWVTQLVFPGKRRKKIFLKTLFYVQQQRVISPHSFIR